ncbi:hypothetical protein K1719_040892 [Acacia pycnantha]|nr:hypothetical protein K1719_040892 [Acacia pycnantha]
MLERPQHVNLYTWEFHASLWLVLYMHTMLVLAFLEKMVWSVWFPEMKSMKLKSVWRRYCKGDVPSLKRMEFLQQAATMSNPSNKTSESIRMANSIESSPGSVKTSELNSSQPSKLNTRSCEENRGSLNGLGFLYFFWCS